MPFKRIDDTNIKYQVPENLRDNSYAAFMKQTGDDFGKAANDKLIVTRGKGFRKEKQNHGVGPCDKEVIPKAYIVCRNIPVIPKIHPR